MRRALALLVATGVAVASADELKRPVPDYDGRGDAPTTAGDVLIWVPRVAVSPLYLVSEYVVRRPVGFLVETVERNGWVESVTDYLNGPVGIIPTGLIDVGLPSTVGFYFWWDGALVDGNHVRASASFGSNVIVATLVDRVDVGAWQIAARGAISRRDNMLFYGIGPEVGFEDPTRYQDHRLSASLSASVRFAGLSRFTAEAGAASVDFHDASCCDDPSLLQGVAMGLFALPPGFAEGGYTGPFSHAQLVLDSRAEAPGTGVAVALDGQQGSDPRTDRVWLRAGADLSGSLELGKRRRVGSLILHAAVAEPLAGDDVPFTELATLGGSGPLPGFIAGRLLGRSALAATLQYEWPVWAFLTGVFQAGAGNVFGEHFDGFEADRLRGSLGMGVRSVGLGDHRFELLVALGTKPFHDGLSVDAVRFEIGGVIGF